MLNYRSYGPADARTLCFLHGFMGSSDDWDDVVSALDGDLRRITVDLPGHGRSLQQPDHAYSMEGAAQALADVFDHANVETCSLVGYSMGGRVALYHALFHPDRIRGLVIESTSPGLRSEAEREERLRVDANRAERISADLPAFLDEWYRKPLFASLERHDLVEEMVQRRSRNDPAELARALTGMSPGRQPSLWSKLTWLSIPTLVLTGELDDKYKEITSETAERIDQARRVVVSGAGHNVHAERPQAFLAHLSQFLKEG